MTLTPTQAETASKQLLVAKVLLWIAAISAFLAGISAIADVANATNNTKVLVTWRLFGYITFAGLFAILALRPRANMAIWALVIFNKVALTVTGLVYLRQGGIAQTDDILIWDGALSLLLIVAFLLSHIRQQPSK